MTYGQLDSERQAAENTLCRELVRDISALEISERQRIMIIYLLALEIEDIELMRALTDPIKVIAGNKVFLSQGDTNG
jgi:hypothetical protein